METLMRSLLALAILAALGLLAGCNTSSGGTPVGVQISVSVTASPSSINQGQTSTLTAVVNNDSSGKGVTWSLSGVGKLTNESSTGATYNAPATVPNTQVVSITATSVADTSVSNSASVTVNGSVNGNIVVSLAASATTINQSGTSAITATVTGDNTNSGVSWVLTPSGEGSLSSQTSTSATYNAPSVSSPTQVTITASSKANSSAAFSITIIVLPSGAANNVEAAYVDGGPLLNANPPVSYPNGVFASATICQPGSTTSCVTVDHILVDTGSFGLRILQSALNNVSLTPISSGGLVLNDCINFGDGSFLWGEVAPADVQIAGEKASSVPIHLVADPTGGSSQIPTSCSNGGTDADNLSGLAANGILGIGPEPTDCIYDLTDYCDGSNNGQVALVYYWCSNPATSSCTAGTAAVPATQQVTNPVVLFTTDNNGTSINFPAVGTGQSTATGTLTFGINTQSNNSVGSATVYTAAATGTGLGWAIATTYNNVGYFPYSFIDSGSVAYFIPDPNGNLIAVCPSSDIGFGFFCPASPLMNQSATNVGATTGSGNVFFEIDNADNLFNTGDFALGNLAGPNGTATDCTSGNTSDTSCAFDWGLPFFYGRTVFTSIDLTSVNGQPTSPWWAY